MMKVPKEEKEDNDSSSTTNFSGYTPLPHLLMLQKGRCNDGKPTLLPFHEQRKKKSHYNAGLLDWTVVIHHPKRGGTLYRCE